MEDGATRADFDRACLWVGRFMFHFAMLESSVDDAIGKLLSVKSMQNRILVRNIEFSRKINILKSAVSLTGKDADKVTLLNRVIKASEMRNVIAHTVFGPEQGGVRFLTVSAKSKLKFPETFFTAKQFANLIKELSELQDLIDTMVVEMTKPSMNALKAIMTEAMTPPV